MPNPRVPRRASCSACLRPAATCLCHWRCEIDNPVEVLILQHPLERLQAKGSARLLQLCLQRSQLVVGERFEPEVLAALFGPVGGGTWLLYPDVPAAPAPAFTAAEPPQRLVVLDATWRKSLKMLLLNPPLQQLPRCLLQAPPASRYAIRKAPRAGQLSTLEATALALQQLDGTAGRYAPLWAAFEGFVAERAMRRPAV